MSRVWGGQLFAFMVEGLSLVAASSKLSLALLVVGGGERDGGFFGVEGDVALSGMLLPGVVRDFCFPNGDGQKGKRAKGEVYTSAHSPGRHIGRG